MNGARISLPSTSDQNDLKFDGIDFLVTKDDIVKFEKQNKIKINVFSIEKGKKEIYETTTENFHESLHGYGVYKDDKK